MGTIAGCMVLNGKVTRNSKIRLLRDGIVKYDGELESLKRFKDDVKEVTKGYECGLNIKGYNDIEVGDILEVYEEIEVKKNLNSLFIIAKSRVTSGFFYQFIYINSK